MPTERSVFEYQAQPRPEPAIGAMAEFERALIQERVKAGLRNARAKGKELGRLRMTVDAGEIAALHAQGHSLRAIASELGVGLATLHRASASRSKT
jgi:DNA invertase Pin-like site-specific DNA recombinase